MASRASPKLSKLRIIVVGGEARNLQSKRLKSLFDFTHIDKGHNKVPEAAAKGNPVAVVILRWVKGRNVIRDAKAFAKRHNLPAIECSSMGKMIFYLSDQIPAVKRYMEAVEGTPQPVPKAEKQSKHDGTDDVPLGEEKGKKGVQGKPPGTDPDELDEDTLWEAYGEAFVQQITGLNGEACDRATFLEILEEETGLGGKHQAIETIFALLRRQGVVTEHDGGLVAIGDVMPVDLEKKRKFILSQQDKRKFENKGSGTIRNEVREAFDESEVDVDNLYGRGETQKIGTFTDEELLHFFYQLGESRVFDNLPHLFRELYKLGLKQRSGKPYAYGTMRVFWDKAKGLGVSQRKKDSWKFQLTLPKLKDMEAAKESSEAVHEELPEIPTDRAIPLHELKPTAPAPAPLTLTEELKKPGKIYNLIEKSYPGKGIPGLVGLGETALALKSISSEPGWNRFAAEAVLLRIKLPSSDENIRIIIGAKLDFNDEEWSYFALEFLRDQTLQALFPVIVKKDGVHRTCMECQEDFFFPFPRRCRDCFQKQRRIYEDAKGGS